MSKLQRRFLPFCDALVSAYDGRLDVDGVVPHPPQLHSLVQGPDHVQGVVPLCGTDGRHMRSDNRSQKPHRSHGLFASVNQVPNESASLAYLNKRIALVTVHHALENLYFISSL